MTRRRAGRNPCLLVPAALGVVLVAVIGLKALGEALLKEALEAADALGGNAE